jgi:hypothetical protein
LGHRPLPLRHKVNEREAPLATGEIGVTEQVLATLDGDLTG